MPPVMMTCVTPTAMMPITDTCRMMIDRRCLLARKLWPTKIQPRISNTMRDADQHQQDARPRAAIFRTLRMS